MIEEDLQARVWHVVFCKASTKHWLLDRLKFGHVYAMRKSPAGKMWTIVNPTTSVLDATTIPVALCEHPMDYNSNSVVSVRVIVRPEILKPFKVGFGFLTCVTAIKSLLGINASFIYTPNQLLKHLKGVENGRTNRETQEVCR